MSSRHQPIAILVCALLSLAGCQTVPERQARDARQPRPAAIEPDIFASQARHTAQIGRPPAQTAPSTAPEAPGPAQGADIWTRIRDSFELQATDEPRIEEELSWYLEHRDYLVRVQERARPYLYHITREVQRRGMPGEIILLPLIESAFQPFAYSSGHAAGLWQLIPATGRMLGLKQNWWYDGRRDIVASTRAALDLLQTLNQQFDGDWLLALAAYNCGGGTVSRAIAKNQKRGRPTDFWSLDLPEETRNYVPRLLAASRMFAGAERYGLELLPIPPEPFFAAVDVGDQLDLALAADMAGIAFEKLRILNPAFNHAATAPDGPHRLLLPVAQVEHFERQLAALDPDQRLRWQRHEVRQGDTLSQIAGRYGTSVQALLQVNHLSRNGIRAGQQLLIPSSTQASDPPAGRRLLADRTAIRHKGMPITYNVRPGDTLWDIARYHKVKVDELAAWNGRTPRDPLHPGETLVVWTGGAGTIASRRNTRQDRQSLHYTVQTGDSLYSIAQRFSVSVVDLKSWNSLPGRYLQPGQQIKLYVDVAEQTL